MFTPTTDISKILDRISSNVIAVPCDSSQETVPRELRGSYPG